mmetsp:Transcript_55054/g.151503  ORF Transcript_55054/g.151503 Transcript_55054/m.151503 type:complete len:116 (-) Transcript_55054:58-405(-)
MSWEISVCLGRQNRGSFALQPSHQWAEIDMSLGVPSSFAEHTEQEDSQARGARSPPIPQSQAVSHAADPRLFVMKEGVVWVAALASCPAWSLVVRLRRAKVPEGVATLMAVNAAK